MSWANPSTKDIRREAREIIVGRDRFTFRYWWLLNGRRGEDYWQRVDDMVELLRQRAARRGKTKFKRHYKRTRKGNGGACGGREWDCSYCRPAELSYSYGPRGRIDHRVFNEPLERIMEFLGEEPFEDEGLFDFVNRIFLYGLPEVFMQWDLDHICSLTGTDVDGKA
jgi:hypothetical protein